MSLQAEPGSFRDRHGRIFYRDGAVLRAISERAHQDWDTLCSTDFFRRLTSERKLIPTEEVGTSELPPADDGATWSTVLRHERVPFVTYPYEWCFGMLQDAALLQLELLESALDEGMILKDATPFNLQWIGARPVFIDIPSFEKLPPGQPWIAYRQFCEMFLFPLFLQAYKNVPFQPWFRGNIEGVTSESCNNLMSLRDRLRPGVLLHVFLQAKAQARYAQSSTDIRSELKQAGFQPEMIKANVARLQKLVRQLRWSASESTWADYASTNSYDAVDSEKKAAFVRGVVRSRPWDLVWDLGANTGTYSRIAAENARSVVAMDSDHLAVERFYRELKCEGNDEILPMVGNVANPSPNLGWRGLERKSLTDRSRPDLTLCLALIHHVVITANIPLAEFVAWLAGLGSDLVIEFVTKDDPMVKRLLANKDDQYSDYEIDYFERCLAQSFQIVGRESLTCGTRTLYHAGVRP